MQYQHTKREPEMAELIEGSERDRRRLAELLDGIRVGPGVDAMADGMREAVWADVRSRIRRRGIRMRIVPVSYTHLRRMNSAISLHESVTSAQASAAPASSSVRSPSAGGASRMPRAPRLRASRMSVARSPMT